MANFTENNVQYTSINTDSIVINKKIAATTYQVDQSNNITFHKPIINAIDIDWNNANITGLDNSIKTTSDLIKQLANVVAASKTIPHKASDLSDYTNLLTQQNIEALKPQLTGKSAYEIAKEVYEETYHVDFPYSTHAEWVASLKGKTGDPGQPGINGKSAYEIAKQYYQSISEEFPYTSEYEWIQDVISGNDTKSYTDEEISNLRTSLLNTINSNETTINLVDNDHLSIRLIETDQTSTDEHGNPITIKVPPYKYDISLKDIASKTELTRISTIVDALNNGGIDEKITQKIDSLKDGVSEAFDTFKEVENWINNLPMNPVEISENIQNLTTEVTNLKGELTIDVPQEDEHGNIIYVTKPKTFDKTGDEYGKSLEEINDILNNLLSTVSTAKDVQDGAEENTIDTILGQEQEFTINNLPVIQKFINVNKEEGSKTITLGVNTTLLNNILNDKGTKVLNESKQYTDQKLSWTVI